jgi:tetratricopeptide (TPR) repeat protein
MDPQAKVHLDRGFEHYQAGEYEQAIEELEKGYSIQPRVEFLFAWAQAARFAGRYELAIEKYEAFVAGGATQSQIDAARALIDECKDKLEIQREAERRAEAKLRKEQEQAAAEREAEPEPEPATDTDWRRDPVGGVLVGTGAAALAGGVGLIVAAQVRAGSLDGATTYEEFDRQFEDARRSVPAMRVAGGVLMVAGAGLIVGGIVRYGQKKRAARSSLSSAGVWLDDASAGVVVRGRF